MPASYIAQKCDISQSYRSGVSLQAVVVDHYVCPVDATKIGATN